MKRYAVLTFAVLAVLTMLSACGNKTNTGGNASNAANNTAPPAGGQTKEITVNASNFSFDPPAINLKVGDTVKLTLKNVNGSHGLEIPDLKVNVKNGETATFTVTKAGKFDYNCSIQCGSGHDNMVGTITVS
ncbi:cupredoxin domain-containing protein [Paenibacillus thalictri]|uniref:Cytochrome C oxidase subunit II n=1 Tax=Paenibacillus thalictri TaxID=2527873 RepID=A0A4Q9DHP5_9BACL|nr:cupredoxin domain-containing protein [Paenibacillus thalictri]TBL70709.1 cytochrome C oxidase subunit II [Paenibacillus thalictri]